MVAEEEAGQEHQRRSSLQHNASEASILSSQPSVADGKSRRSASVDKSRPRTPNGAPAVPALSHSPAGQDPEKADISTPQTSTSKAGPSIGGHGVPSMGPPDGGTMAWLQVLGAFFLFFNTWGLLNTFGVYQTYYESGQLFTESSSNISWIGAIQAFLVLFVGAVTGPVYDAGYFHYLIGIGSFMIVFGHMMLSLATKFWEVLLSQAFCVGIGAGCLFTPSISILSTYFSKKIPTAIGLAACGSSLGGVIYPIVFYELVGQIGFGWTTRVLGFMALATLLVSNAVMRMRVLPPSKRKLLDPTAFKDLPFLIFAFGCFIGFMGVFVPFFYISYFAQSRGLTNDRISFYIVPIFNAASSFGRVLPNILAQRIGPMNVMIPGTIITGMLVFCTLAATNSAGIIVLSAFIGFFSGIFVSMPPSVFVQLTENKRIIGTRVGMAFAFMSLGVLAGGPGGGAILGTDIHHLDWTGAIVFSGVLLLASAVIFTCVRFMRSGPNIMSKV